MTISTILPWISPSTCHRWQATTTTAPSTSAPKSEKAAADLHRIGAVSCVGARSVSLLALVSILLSGALFASDPADDWARNAALANNLVESGGLARAETAYKDALTQALIAGDGVGVGVVLQNMGWLLDRLGRQLEAEKAYLQAIQAFHSAGVKDQRLIVRAFVGLSVVYVQTGQYSKAEELIRRGLADYPAGGDLDRASLMGSLGAVLAHKQKFSEAEQALRNTAQQCLDHPSPEVREVGAIALANLARLHPRNAPDSEALEMFRQAVAVMEAVPAPAPGTLCMTLADYASAVRRTGDPLTAEQLYRRAISLAETQLGPGHVILANLLRQYGELASEAGRKSEARKFQQSARRIEDEWSRTNMIGHTVEIQSLFVRR